MTRGILVCNLLVSVGKHFRRPPLLQSSKLTVSDLPAEWNVELRGCIDFTRAFPACVYMQRGVIASNRAALHDYATTTVLCSTCSRHSRSYDTQYDEDRYHNQRRVCRL